METLEKQVGYKKIKKLRYFGLTLKVKIEGLQCERQTGLALERQMRSSVSLPHSMYLPY